MSSLRLQQIEKDYWGTLNGNAVSFLSPEYPAAAKAVKAAGTVVVQITID